MQDFTKATMKSSIDCIYDFGATLDSESVSISELIVNVQKRRISWNDFCEEFVNRFHEIQWTAQTMMEDLNEIEQPTEIDISTGVEAIKLYASFLERIMK
jgi:hypothetical protein